MTMPEPGQPKSQRTILVVDDEEPARRLIKLLLEREGYRVFTSANGPEALILAKVEQPDAMLLDILMPRMNGHDVLKRLKTDPDTCLIPVIILSAKGADRDIQTSFHLGAVYHMEKPFETLDLLEKIKIACVQATRDAAGPPGPSEG